MKLNPYLRVNSNLPKKSILGKIFFNERVVDGVVIFGLTLLFCLHYYHSDFIFQGDVLTNLYLHQSPLRFREGWDPKMLHYMGWYPVYGEYFPFNIVMHVLIEHVFHGSYYSTLKLLQVNGVCSLFTLWFFFYELLKFWGRSRIASLSGAMFISLSGFHIQAGVRELNLFFIHSFLCVPVVYLFLLRAIRNDSYYCSIFAGFWMGLSILSGSPVPFFFFFPTFFALPWLEQKGFGAQKYLLIATFVGFLMGARVILPSIAYMGFSSRQLFQSTWESVANHTPSIIYTIFSIFFRDFWFHPRIDMTPLTHLRCHELDSFIGLPALFLVISGIKVNIGRLKKMMIATGVITMCIMHLRYFPEWLGAPIVSGLGLFLIRHPYRLFMLLLLPLGFFYSCGFEKIKNIKTTKFLIFAFLIYLLFGIVIYRWGYISLRVGSLVSVLILTAAFFMFFMSKREVLLFISLFLIHFFSIGDFYIVWEKNPPLRMTERQSLEKLVVSQREKWSHLGDGVYRIFNPFLEANLSMVHNIWVSGEKKDIAFEPARDAGTPRHMLKFVSLVKGLESPLLSLYNVKYLLSDSYRGSKLIQTSLRDVYENVDVLNRFFLVHYERVFSNENDLWHELEMSSLELIQNEAFLLEDTPLSQADESIRPTEPNKKSIENNEIKFLKLENTKIHLEIFAKKPSLLIASFPFFPAWKASVNGEGTKILRAYGALNGIYLGEGFSKVELHFQDVYRYWGGIVTGSTVLLLFIILGAINVRPYLLASLRARNRIPNLEI